MINHPHPCRTALSKRGHEGHSTIAASKDFTEKSKFSLIDHIVDLLLLINYTLIN